MRVEPERGNDASFLVYADELVRAGDPRGELIHLDHALAQRHTPELVGARTALLSRHPELQPEGAIQLDWHLGFVRVVAIDTVDDIDELLAHPSLRFVERLIVNTFQLAQADIEALAKHVPPHLLSLALGQPWAAYGYEHTSLDVDPLFDHPLLELEARVPIHLTRIVPSLRSLVASIWSNRPLGIRFEHLPNLDRVMLFGDANPVNLRDILARPLVEFGAVYVPIDAATIDQLATMPSLRRLRLWNAGLTHDVRSRFAHLDQLDLMDDFA